MGRFWATPEDIANEMGIDVKSVRKWPYLEVNPLHVCLPPGNKKQWRVLWDEFNEWAVNTWEDPNYVEK